MFLIMSAAYVSQELESEFGTIPPAFLPLGNRRLFQHQVASAPEGKKIYLSLPESYQLETYDEAWLSKHGVALLRIPDGLSLGASLVSALTLADYDHKSSLSILFGDTLFSELPGGEDIITISQVENSYDWAIVTNDNSHWLDTPQHRHLLDQNNVVCGYFKFSQPQRLLKALTMAHWDFIQSLNYYHEECGLNSVHVSNWLDFGHLNTYYTSKAKFTTQRAFNHLEITPKWIRKSSTKNQKIAAEAYWFEQVPPILRTYLPQFLGTQTQNGTVSYQLEYLHHTALNELFVFSTLPELVWKQILSSCLDFIDACQQHTPATDNHQPIQSLEVLFGEKTRQRLTEYCQSVGCEMATPWTFNDNLSASFADLLAASEQYLPTASLPPSVMHGDYCFSNILYDFRSDKIKTIDPRGMDVHGDFTVYGDVRYDLAKLSHSVLGLYDWIIAGYYEVSVVQRAITFRLDIPKHIKSIQQLFITLMKEKYQLSDKALYAMQIQLFLSMLPLHADDLRRQQALMANAFRLYQLIQDAEV